MSLTAEQRTMRARMGAHKSWAKTVDRTARTAPARRASLARFERQVDPDGTLPAEVRARMAEQAERAWMLEMSYRASVARTKAAEARRKAKQLDADASAAEAALAELNGTDAEAVSQ